MDKWTKIFSFSNVILFYWFSFWLMNGLDKFLIQKSLLFFTWYGKDRNEQFTLYFQRIDLPESWVNPLLYVVAIWELAIAFPFLATLWIQISSSRFSKVWFELGMSLTAMTFIIFCLFDIIFGDRAELLEHSTFLILVCVTYQLVLHESRKVFSTSNE